MGTAHGYVCVFDFAWVCMGFRWYDRVGPHSTHRAHAARARTNNPHGGSLCFVGRLLMLGTCVFENIRLFPSVTHVPIDPASVTSTFCSRSSGAASRNPARAVASRGEGRVAPPRATDEQLVGVGQGVCALSSRKEGVRCAARCGPGAGGVWAGGSARAACTARGPGCEGWGGLGHARSAR